ncbi:MAG TPA: nitroreductase [Bacillota bacterium]|nr:nitroreductase [Bacillota bacterium]
MELSEAIRTRRSVRKYRSEPLPERTVRELIELAVWAPSGMNGQPWAFVVVEDGEYMKGLSGRAKKFLLDRIDKSGGRYERYTGVLSDPAFDIFYGAPVLVLIYGDRSHLTYICDCSMAALNLMLAARDRGIGSCWIGFATGIGNTPEVKAELKVPEEYELVAPVVLGYPAGPAGKGVRNEAKIISWRRGT